MNRQHIITKLENLSDSIWDVLIIGGGATGLGIAVDSASRGYKTLLLEQSDFAKSTSSKSTKLVHGGVRYMAQGDLGLVMEACHERGILLKNAPHLTSNQEFIIPVYTRFDVLKYTAGLKFYDLLAGTLSLGKSYFINSREVKERLPDIKLEGLRGGIVYHDGQFDDSRLAIALAHKCTELGGFVLNYCRVTELVKDKSGMLTGAMAVEQASGKVYSFSSKLVINATGVFADTIAAMDDPASQPTIRPSQGVHVVLDRSFLKSDSAVMIPKTSDGRVLFAIPWYDVVVAGTTDTPVGSASLEPVALKDEVEFILRTAGEYFVKQPSEKDILSVFAGLRPLAANNNGGSTKEVSRRHKINLSSSGLLSIVGGKWTTYRRMAEEIISRAIKEGFIENRKCRTKDLRISSEERYESGDFLRIYDKGKAEIKDMISRRPELGKRLHEKLPYTVAEIIWIIRNEMPLSIEDVLARRTRSILLNASASEEAAADVAGIMASEMGFDNNWQTEQTKSYSLLVKNYLSFT